MEKRKISKRKVFIFISLFIFFASVVFYGIRFIHFYRIENRGVVQNEK